MDPYDVFISYRSSDGQQVAALHECLRRAGLRTWFDQREIEEFSSITRGIEEGLKNSHAFVAWISDDYFRSMPCLLELAAAILAARAQGAAASRILLLDSHGDASRFDKIGLSFLKDNVLKIPAAPRKLQHADAERGLDALALKIAERVQSLRGTLTSATLTGEFAQYGRRPAFGDTSAIISRNLELLRVFGVLHGHEYPIATGKTSPVAALLRGPRGIGKTNVLCQYASVFRSAYPAGIFWIDCHSSARGEVADEGLREAIDIQERRILTAIAMQPTDGLDALQVRSILAEELERRPGDYLWILLDVPNEVSEENSQWLRAPTARGHVALTSIAWHDRIATALTIPPVERSDAHQFLAAHRTPGDPDDRVMLASLIEQSRGLPGRLRAWAAALEHFNYARVLRAVERGDDGLDVFEELVREIGGFARGVLMACSECADNYVPYELLEDVYASVSLAVGVEHTPLHVAVSRLENDYLVELDADGNVRLTNNGRALAVKQNGSGSVLPPFRSALLTSLARRIPPKVDFDLRRDRYDLLLEHARYLCRNIDGEEAAEVVGRIGVIYAAIGQHDHERSAFERQVSWFQENLGAVHPKTLWARYETGVCMSSQDPRRAPCMSQLLADARDALGASDPVTLRVRFECAINRAESRLQSDLRAAVDELRELEEAWVRIDGPRVPGVFICRNSRLLFEAELGRTGRERDAEMAAAFSDLYNAAAAALGPHDNVTLRIQENFAIFLGKAGRSEESHAMTLGCLSLRERRHGVRHSLTVWSATNAMASFQQLSTARAPSAAEWEQSREVFNKYCAWMFTAFRPELLSTTAFPGRAMTNQHLEFRATHVDATRDLAWRYARRLWPHPPRGPEDICARGRFFRDMFGTVLGPASDEFAMIIADHLSYLCHTKNRDELVREFLPHLGAWNAAIASRCVPKRVHSKELLSEIKKCEKLCSPDRFRFRLPW